MFDNRAVIALLLTAAAGMSMLIGAFLVAAAGRKSELLVSFAVALAAGVMLSLALMDLLPEAQEYFENKFDSSLSAFLSVIFLALGIIVAALADYLIPHNCHCEYGSENEKDSFNRMGIVTAISMGLHNIPEGIVLFITAYEDLSLGLSLAVAVALHNIPAGITIAMPVYFSTGSRRNAFFYTLIPSLMQLLGALVACVFLVNHLNVVIMGMLLSLIAGFLLFMSLYELYPMSQQYGFQKISFFAMVMGIILMPLTHMLHLN